MFPPSPSDSLLYSFHRGESGMDICARVCVNLVVYYGLAHVGLFYSTILPILLLLLLLLLLLPHYCCFYCCCSYYCCSYYLFDVIVCDPRARAGLLPLLLLPPLYLHNDCHQITFRGAGKEPRSTPTMVKPRRNCCSGAGCRVTLREDNSAGAPLPFGVAVLRVVDVLRVPR